jgi:hypothetical protein
VLTAVSDARAVLGAKEVAGLQIGSSVSLIGRFDLRNPGQGVVGMNFTKDI